MNHSVAHFDALTNPAGGVRNVRVWRNSGAEAPTFSAPVDVSWTADRFIEIGSAVETATAAEVFDGSGLWLIPGLVDAHLHAGWQAFHEADREKIGAERTSELIATGIRRTLYSGFTSVRDAGGLSALAARELGEAPRVQTAGHLIDRAVADSAGGIEYAVAAVLESGAQWVKLVATAGVASPAGSGLEPTFSAAEVSRATKLAASAGAGVMVHAWGGEAIDYTIEAATQHRGTPVSLEHGIFLTQAQAQRAAQAGLTFVPTLRIYRLVQTMISTGDLPASFEPRVREAVNAHPNAVRIARDAGLAIALGTDYGTPDQHGTGRLEFDAIVAAGLTTTEALVAATRGGATLLAGVDPDQNQALAGRVTPGAPADGVLLTRDPRAPGALSDPGAIAAVILAGRVVAPASFERNPS